VMKTHTTKGATILSPVSELKEMIPGIELHHESLDGRGYPHGLKGDEIPLLPRIIAVADTFDALTTNRPYQQQHEVHDALRIIHSLSGKRLDPIAVFALDAVYQRGEIRIQRSPLAVPAQPAPSKAPATPPAAKAAEVHAETAAAAVETLRS
jgi:HD-GYP domain-containing protein (c-di-GMP phosphodiesterase class II)